MRPALMTGAMAIPLEHVRDVHSVTKALTVNHKPMGATVATLVEAYRIDDGYIHVPRQFGLDYCQRNRIPYEDHTSAGFAVDFPKIPQPRDYQASLLDEIEERFGAYYDFIFRAHTGWGKTIGALIGAARAATTTLIIVDQDNLKEQWLAALAQHFGMTPENGHVGFVQGPACDYEGRSVVIAMVQTLSQKMYAPEFYSYFGRVIFDEVHTVGAPTFSVVLMDFPAQTRLGVSATPKRKDALQKLLEYSLGKIRVAADKEHDTSAVYVRQHETIYSWYANISPKVGRIVNEVTDDASRNLLLAESVQSLYESGRHGLILSDRIEQLKHLISLSYYLGTDSEQLGLYAGYDPVYRYAKDPKPARRPNYLITHDETGEAEYSPVKLQLIAKRIPKKQLARVKTDAELLHATYGMCAKGFDEPRLKFGVDASPRSEVEQIHGRILRVKPGTKMPIWMTIRDINSYRLLYGFANRIAGYQKSNGRIYEWDADGELHECLETEIIKDARDQSNRLKECRIETQSDGRNIVVTPSSAKTSEKQRALEAVSKIRSRRRD